MPFLDTSPLKKWFLDQKRDLPWRRSPSAYAVLVSEIMLQQTQVATVIPYFLRWMDLFPNFQALADANIHEVMKCWEGLGYYSRAKNLKKAAIYIIEQCQGQMPSSSEGLAKIPGVGPYTAGAIQAFAFHQKAAAVDGNVMRVLSRYFAIHEDIAKMTTQKKIRELTFSILPELEPWIISEALIELGALICKKKPDCITCPLKTTCHSYQNDLVEKLPIKMKPKGTSLLFRSVPILMHQDQVLIQQIPEGKIMAHLHEFPYFEEEMSSEILQTRVQEVFQLKTEAIRQFPLVTHSFTRYRAELKPILLLCKQKKEIDGYFWVELKKASKLAFSSGHKRILQMIS